MREPTPKAVLLRDYTPPAFLIDDVDLVFELDESTTTVSASMRMRPNPAAVSPSRTLELSGERLILEAIELDGTALAPAAYVVSDTGLTVTSVPAEPFTLRILTRIDPAANSALEGLFVSNGMLCTQCEAEGFRKITYFLDRPDVMARFTTTLRADRERYPVLLSNGNPVASGDLADGRHWVRWEDPFPKPCYLFALVAGRLACLEDEFVTASDRTVALQIYVEAHDLDKCAHAMASLKRAMRWDEERYGREYDLDLYMIVAVSHFNMGAMENKGLNVFNTKYVLARPDTATDADYEHVQGVIGHEYFHNWTGNRITCRDWFQLSLKEGLTVFRDQEFTADLTSRAVKRIDDVEHLRVRQFAEDAGPLAHPVRPDSYIEINNFYTVTVYEKGAEVVRMLQTLVGAAGFRRGTDLYFERHDGQAVTCDDFVRCMEDANGADLTQFRRWYSQAGTPELHIHTEYDVERRSFTLRVRQSCPPTPGQAEKAPFHIPLAIGLLGPDGVELPVRLDGDATDFAGTTRVLDVRQPEQSFRFPNMPARPVLSALRGFSAPVKLTIQREPDELGFLLAHDADPFCRWEAAQQLATLTIHARMRALQTGAAAPATDALRDGFANVLAQEWTDLSYLALLLSLPSDDSLASGLDPVDPSAVHEARQQIRRELADAFEARLRALYEQHHREEPDVFDAAAVGRRRLKNVCLGYLVCRETPDAHALALAQFETARTMTDQFAALGAIANSEHPERHASLDRFFSQWRAEPLVIDKWFALQAMWSRPGTLPAVRELLTHPDFDIRVPNRVRAVLGAFAQLNPLNFHAADGSGYAFLADRVIELNRINPQLAARMLGPLTAWRRLEQTRREAMRRELARVAAIPDLSADVFEVASKGLGA
ncbi:MAG: aminopeptidase N [Methylotetracoccus sp.]